MNVLIELMKKEIKETFRNPRYIIFTILFPLILFPAIGYIYNFSFQAAQEQVARLSVYVVNLDNGSLGDEFISFLKKINITVVEIDLSDLNSSGYQLALIIPENFTSSFSEGISSNIIIKSRIGSLSFTMVNIFQRGEALVNAFERYLRRNIISQVGLDAEFLNNMFETEVYVYVDEWGREVPGRSIASIALQLFLVPWLIFGLVVSILQVSAAMLSEEKEYKTLETLLTLPISRKILALEKILGSVVVAFAATAAYTVGFLIYVFFLGTGALAVDSGLTDLIGVDILSGVRPDIIVLLSLLFFLTILITGGIGLLLSLFTQDTKTAEGLTATVSMPILVLILFGVLIDISILPEYIRIIYYSIPFVYLIKSFEYLLVNRIDMYLVGIIVNIFWLLIILTLVAKMFESERLLTMKLSFSLKIGRRGGEG